MLDSPEFDGFDEVFDVEHRVRDLLEDFEFVGNLSEGALIPNRPWDRTLQSNVKVALAATSLRVKSLDYVKRRYCGDQSPGVTENDRTKYVNAYNIAKIHMRTVVKRLVTDNKDLPTSGVFGASLVLERLKASFFLSTPFVQTRE